LEHFRKLLVLIVAFGIVIGFWEQLGGAPSQVVDNLIAPLRELFGPGASTTGKLFGVGMAALAAAAIIYTIRKASHRGRSQSAKALLRNLVARAAEQVEHEARMARGRGRESVSVRLVPQVPIRNESANGWFGGAARLPAGLRWPEIDGAPLQLLVQVDCAALPAGLWDGLGPRHGWLAIFIEPVNYTVQVTHFAEVGQLTPGPALPPDNQITGYDMRTRPGEVGLIQAIPHWPVDVVAVFDGKDDPRREGWHKSSDVRYGQRHDIATPALMPFDWPTARTMMEMVVAGVSRAIPTEAAPHLEPEALAKVESKIAEASASGATPDSVLDQRANLDDLRVMAKVRDHALQKGPAILQRLQALKARVESMAAEAPFSAAAIAPVLAEMHGMTWMHVSAPPFYRDGRKLTSQERFDEGVELMSLPLTTHDPVSHLWLHGFEIYRRDRAKHAYARDPESLPAEARSDCEEIWKDMTTHEVGGMGHVPWHYVDEFDERDDVTLVELPSSSLMNWMFGDVHSLVITMTKADLAAGAFDRVKMQVSN
jgi:uncharacterized protein YwqG